MSALDRNPVNQNLLAPNKFQLNFSRIPNVQFFCQTVGLPGVSMSEVMRTTPFVDLYSPGEKIIYDLLNVTFIIDEDIQTWVEIHNWIRGMTFPTDFKEYEQLKTLSKFSNPVRPQYSDATLTLLTNANNPNYKIHFYDCFPTTLSSIMFSSTDTPDTTMTADVSFRFAYYDIEKS